MNVKGLGATQTGNLRSVFVTDVAWLKKREILVGQQLRNADLLPDYGRIAARFDQIAELVRLMGDEKIAERLHRHAWQMREDQRVSTAEFQLAR